jgi:hypothetical protein
MAIDAAGGKIYWVDAATWKVQRANLDGSNAEDLVNTAFDNPASIALKKQSMAFARLIAPLSAAERIDCCGRLTGPGRILSMISGSIPDSFWRA